MKPRSPGIGSKRTTRALDWALNLWVFREHLGCVPIEVEAAPKGSEGRYFLEPGGWLSEIIEGFPSDREATFT